jgi:hypothetical protein
MNNLLNNAIHDLGYGVAIFRTFLQNKLATLRIHKQKGHF